MHPVLGPGLSRQKIILTLHIGCHPGQTFTQHANCYSRCKRELPGIVGQASKHRRQGSSSVTNTWQFSSQMVGIHFIEKLMPNLALKVPVITVAGNSPFINTQGKLMERTVTQQWALTAEQNKIKATTSKYTNHLLFPASCNHIQ